MNFKGKEVLVTGAGGFIGSHLVERLVKEGANVTALLRSNNIGLLDQLSKKTMKDIRIKYGDITDLGSVNKVMKNSSIVFNLAAKVSTPYSYKNPIEVVNINLNGTLNLLSKARDTGVQKFIQTSTSDVYGAAEYLPIDEDHPKKSQSPYSASKIGADALALSFYNTYEMPVTIIRPFNTYGPRQSARAVIPSITTQVLTKKELRVGKTGVTRDFTYIDDTIDGFIKIAESNNSIGQEINIGSGVELSISEVINTILRLTGGNINLIHDSKRKRPKQSEISRLCADNTKAKRLIAWSPENDFEDGLVKTINWIKNNLEMYNIGKYEI